MNDSVSDKIRLALGDFGDSQDVNNIRDAYNSLFDQHSDFMTEDGLIKILVDLYFKACGSLLNELL